MWEDRLQEIIDQARRLLETHQDEANRIAEQINKIIEDTHGLLEGLGEAVSEVVDALADFASDVWNWVQDHADFIKNIGDAFGAMSTALGAAALAVAAAGLFFPPLEGVAGVLGAASAITSGVALGAHLLARGAGAEVGWDTIGLDALGVGSAGVGKVATRLGTTVHKLAAKGYDASVVGAGVTGPGGVGGVVDTFGKYWLPDSAGEAALASIPYPVPGAGLPALAVWNAWEEAQGTNG